MTQRVLQQRPEGLGRQRLALLRLQAERADSIGDLSLVQLAGTEEPEGFADEVGSLGVGNEGRSSRLVPSVQIAKGLLEVVPSIVPSKITNEAGVEEEPTLV